MTRNHSFLKYTRFDYLRALGIAPLAVIPVVLLIDLLVIVPTDSIISNTQNSFEKFTSWANLMLVLSVPSAYVSTAFFGAFGCLLANQRRYRGTPAFGAAAGMICGAATGIEWIIFLTRENFSLQVLYTGLTGAIILPISVLSGLFVGVTFVNLINRQDRSCLVRDAG